MEGNEQRATARPESNDLSNLIGINLNQFILSNVKRKKKFQSIHIQKPNIELQT